MDKISVCLFFWMDLTRDLPIYTHSHDFFRNSQLGDAWLQYILYFMIRKHRNYLHLVNMHILLVLSWDIMTTDYMCPWILPKMHDYLVLYIQWRPQRSSIAWENDLTCYVRRINFFRLRCRRICNTDWNSKHNLFLDVYFEH